MIKVENLYKGFDGTPVLKDISVTYEPGKCNMIIGASGSGKTVLLKNLIGLMQPDSGDIWYGDKRMSDMASKEKMKLRQRIGILFQGSALLVFLMCVSFLLDIFFYLLALLMNVPLALLMYLTFLIVSSFCLCFYPSLHQEHLFL